MLAKNLDTLNVADQASSPSAVDSKDDRQPYTDSYSFTVSQRLPWSSLLEVAYVGNQSRDLGIPRARAANINLVPVGAMLNQGVDPNSLTADNFRPLKGFSDSEPGHQQRIRQLQCYAVDVDPHQGPIHHQHELHVRQGDGAVCT